METRTRDQIEEDIFGILKLNGIHPNHYVTQALTDYVEEIVQEEVDEACYDTLGIVKLI